MRIRFHLPFRSVAAAAVLAGLMLFPGLASSQPTLDQATVPKASPIEEPATIEVSGPWTVVVNYKGQKEKFVISRPDLVMVISEKYNSIPVFNPSGPSWRQGIPFTGVNASECSVEGALVPGSVSIFLKEGGEPLTEGTDYILNESSGNIGRTENGKIGPNTTIYASYKYYKQRIDSIVDSGGRMALVRGKPHAVNPEPPVLKDGATRLANIYIPGKIDAIGEDNLFPILDSGEYIPPEKREAAKSLLTKTWNKLVNGEYVKIIAWGDSVTECGFIPDDQRWQVQFVTWLRERFPRAEIELVTEAWGGRNTDSYFGEPAGSPHNFKEKVLDAKPDLVISEFVNDGGFNKEKVEQNYGRIRDELAKIGAEWIILTPHYIRPNWMGLSVQKDIDQDPRAYTTAIREFCAENNIACADGAALYGRLWREGVPYLTLMVNNINHPNGKGMKIFADALRALFEAP